jgi:hypothetical protein
MVTDILVAAFEGGINYWCTRVDVVVWPPECEFASDVPSHGGNVYLVLDPELDTTVYTLDLASIHRGIRKAAAHYKQTPLAFYENHDAGAADCAVQFALFNELVYG